MQQKNVRGYFGLEALGTLFTNITELVRYIDLNPLRAGLVASLTQLDRYPWCGHSVVLGRQDHFWQDRDYVLKWFGKKVGPAKRA